MDSQHWNGLGSETDCFLNETQISRPKMTRMHSEGTKNGST